jgi:hypothetical protein
MPSPFILPPLPPGWPYRLRSLESQEKRVVATAIPGLGEGWTLQLRGSVPLDAELSEPPLAFGRGGIQRLGTVVVRPYRRGGLVRYVNDRLYASPQRFAHEFSVHQALWVAGFPTVEPLGYGYRRHLWGVEGVYFTRYAEAAAWPTCWQRGVEALPQLKLLLDALAAWGLHAPDLNATNLLLTSTGGMLALDWDRAQWCETRDLPSRYRERLLRSLRKLKAPVDVISSMQRELNSPSE